MAGMVTQARRFGQPHRAAALWEMHETIRTFLQFDIGDEVSCHGQWSGPAVKARTAVEEERVRGMRRTAAVSGIAAALCLPLTSWAQEAAPTDGGSSMGIIAVAIVVVIGLAVAFMPRLRALSGRVVVRDAFGPSAFSTTSLATARSWSTRWTMGRIPSREGLLVGMDVKRGFGRDIEVTLEFEKDGNTRTVVAGRLSPGQNERVNDLIIAYDDGRGTGSAG